MEFVHLVWAGGIIVGTMSFGQWVYASATGGPDHSFWWNASGLLGGSGLALLALVVAFG